MKMLMLPACATSNLETEACRLKPNQVKLPSELKKKNRGSPCLATTWIHWKKNASKKIFIESYTTCYKVQSWLREILREGKMAATSTSAPTKENEIAQT